MRPSVKWLSIVLVLAGAWAFSRWHEAWYGEPFERSLQAVAVASLQEDFALRGVHVRFDHLDATLSGEVGTPAARAEAARRVRRVWGARLRENRIVVPARIDAIVEIDNVPSPDAKPDRTVSIAGFLPESTRALDLPAALSGALRGRGFDARQHWRVKYGPFVGPLPEFDRAALATLAVEFSELPGIGRLELNAGGIRLEGEAFPGMKARLEALAAAAVRPGGGRVRSELSEVDLTPAARAALALVPGLENVEVRFHNAYALLSGRVDTPEAREQAAVAVQSIALARLNPADNRITVAATRPSFSATGNAERRTITFAGLLPDAGWKSRLLDLCARLKPGWQAETAGLKFSPALEKAAWLDPARFGALMESWLTAPAPGSLRLEGGRAILAGGASPARREEWTARLGALGFPPGAVEFDE